MNDELSYVKTNFLSSVYARIVNEGFVDLNLLYKAAYVHIIDLFHRKRVSHGVILKDFSVTFTWHQHLKSRVILPGTLSLEKLDQN